MESGVAGCPPSRLPGILRVMSLRCLRYTLPIHAALGSRTRQRNQIPTFFGSFGLLGKARSNKSGGGHPRRPRDRLITRERDGHTTLRSSLVFLPSILFILSTVLFGTGAGEDALDRIDGMNENKESTHRDRKVQVFCVDSLTRARHCLPQSGQAVARRDDGLWSQDDLPEM